MNKTIEAVKNGQPVTTAEIFDVVNNLMIIDLSIRSADKNVVRAMPVNRCEETDEAYEFSQSCTGLDSMYKLNKADISEIEAEYCDEADAFYVTCKLKTGMELWLLVVNASGMDSQLSDFREMDVYELHDFLEETVSRKNEYSCISARITGVFGFDAKLYPKSVYINDLDDDWRLHISCDTSSFDVPVVDDSVNEFYVKDTDGSTRKIIVKPYGQPFMEISLLFFKKSK